MVRQDTGLILIGLVRSDWRAGDCLHNLTKARDRGGPATLEIDASFRAGLNGLSAGDPVIVVTFPDAARSDLTRLAPPHRAGPPGTTALRSPARPNPIGLSVTRITAINAVAGRVNVEAITSSTAHRRSI